MAMGKALYRKYRSKQLDDVIGQEHVTATLKNALKNKTFGHAYLFTGPRGVGKTSIARILAHELNSLPYTDETAHLDIIEIDAASNRRIDEIRDLRDKVHILPTSATYKVYIIDEVHMLTREAFNALLKTLEEPPKHVIFILATTELHKLPETIVSRTQHFAFRPVDSKTLTKHLATIAKKEKIAIDTDALELIVNHSEGSVRDSISMLDQTRSIEGKIGRPEIESLLGIASHDRLDELVTALQSGSPSTVLTALLNARNAGAKSSSLAEQISTYALQHYNELESAGIATTTLLRSLIDVQASSLPDRMLEIALLEALPKQPQHATITPPLQQGPSTPTKPSPKPTIEPTTSKPAAKAAKKPPAEAPSAKEEQLPSNGAFDISQWPLVLAKIKTKFNTLYGILRMAEPKLYDGKLVLHFKFGFHQKQVNEQKNRQIIADTIHEISGDNLEIACDKANKDTPSNKVATPQEPPAESVDINAISNIFGGAEVVES